MDPGVDIRSEIAAAARALAPDQHDARQIHMSAIAPEDHIDELLAYLVERSGSPEPATGVDLRSLATAALWVGALDLAVDFFTAANAALRNEGRLGLLSRSLIAHAYSSAHLGRLTTLRSDLDEGVRLSVETRQPFFVATGDVAQAVYLAFRGDIDGAGARMAQGERGGPRGAGRRRACRDATRPRDHRPCGGPQRRGVRAAASAVRARSCVVSRDHRGLGERRTLSTLRSRPITQSRRRRFFVTSRQTPPG